MKRTDVTDALTYVVREAIRQYDGAVEMIHGPGDHWWVIDPEFDGWVFRVWVDGVREKRANDTLAPVRIRIPVDIGDLAKRREDERFFERVTSIVDATIERVRADRKAADYRAREFPQWSPYP